MTNRDQDLRTAAKPFLDYFEAYIRCAEPQPGYDPETASSGLMSARYESVLTGELYEGVVRPSDVARLRAALAAPPRPVDAERVEDLDARLKAAGMYTVPEMLGVTPLTKWQTQAGMTSIAFYEQWLDRRAAEFIRMKAGYELGDKPKDDELYEWVLAHSAAFCEARTNLKAALAPKPTGTEAGQAAYEARFSGKTGPKGDAPAWTALDDLTKGVWHSVAGAALAATPTPPVSPTPDSTGTAGATIWRATCGVCDSAWKAEQPETPSKSGTFCPDCRELGLIAPGVLHWRKDAAALTPSAPIAAPVRDDGVREAFERWFARTSIGNGDRGPAQCAFLAGFAAATGTQEGTR